MIKTIDILHREPKRQVGWWHRLFQIVEHLNQRWSVIPTRSRIRCDQIDTVPGSNRQKLQRLNIQLPEELSIVVFDFLKSRLIEIHQVHLVYHHNDLPDPQ